MKIPVVFHGVENQYENILSYFNFEKYNPATSIVSGFSWRPVIFVYP